MPEQPLNERQRADDDEPRDPEHDGDGEDPEEQPFQDAEQAEAADEEQSLHARASA